MAFKQLKTLPHEVYVPKHKVREAERWCKTELGERWSVISNRQGLWSCFWVGPRSKQHQAGTYQFSFDNEEIAMWFALRWS